MPQDFEQAGNKADWGHFKAAQYTGYVLGKARLIVSKHTVVKSEKLAVRTKKKYGKMWDQGVVEEQAAPLRGEQLGTELDGRALA